MKRRLWLRSSVLVSALALSLAACGAGPEVRYYTLSGVGAAASEAAAARVAGDAAGAIGARWPVTLAVLPFTTSLVYARLELVYQPHPRELRFDAYRLWVAKPGRMLSAAVVEHLRRGGRFAAVVEPGRAADYELRGEVLALEEIDRDATHWDANLALRFELVRTADDTTVWRHGFATRRAVPSPSPAAVVEVLDAILADELLVLDASLERWFTSAAARP